MKIAPFLTCIVLSTLLLSGCTTARPSTTNTAALADLDFGSNTGQNFQIWADGSVQAGSTQLDSGVISPDTTNWQGTAVSSIMALNKNGVQVKNTGDLAIDEMVIEFGEPVSDGTDEFGNGVMIVPIRSITYKGLVNSVTPIIQASTEQVALWVGVLADLSADQRDATIAALERDKVITTETVGLIRAALETLSPTP